MNRYAAQGQGMNLLPHVLTAWIDPDQGGVRWELECPYTGDRPCGLFVPCTDSSHLPPVPPSSREEDDPESWLVYEGLREEWADQHPTDTNGAPVHTGPECWFIHMIKDFGEEPEYFLEDMADVKITGPLRVQVGTHGYEDEVTIKFRPWED